MGTNHIGTLYATYSKTSAILNTITPRTVRTLLAVRNAHTQQIHKNLYYISDDKMNITADPRTMKLNKSTTNQTIMLDWLLATNNQVMKYAKIYLDEGFDVVRVSCQPWQLLWPMKGTKIIGRDLLELMYANQTSYMVHGFSIGGYVWSEAMVYAMSNKEKYQAALDRVQAQVWDSVADITEISVGVPLALFPNNKSAQTITKTFIKAYLKAFYYVGTIHYQKACETYYASPCRAPSLFLLSSTDPVGNEQRIRRACDLWIQSGIKCTWQCWPRSPHVRHYLEHPEEYEALLRQHIRKNMPSLQYKPNTHTRISHDVTGTHTMTRPYERVRTQQSAS